MHADGESLGKELANGGVWRLGMNLFQAEVVTQKHVQDRYHLMKTQAELEMF